MRKMGEKIMTMAVEDISVVDVYDLASDIGKECEKIIDVFGADAVTSLMPKVINALELLEALANQNENENSAMQKLTDRIAYLESEKQEKAVFRERFQKELEAIEEQWHNETNELVALVSRLQEENRRIQKQQESPKHDDAKLRDKQLAEADSTANLLNASDFQKMQRLRGQMEKQRDELKVRDQEIEERNSEIENLTIQLERLRNSGRESRKRQKSLQTQVRQLLEERADFLVKEQDQNREISTLRKRLGIADKDDPIKDDEPLFSTVELRDLLLERDSLRAKVADLEAELKLYKPIVEEAKEQEEGDRNSEDSEPPVQGPLPFEPDDAPWKKSSDSGIRKFFRKLFSESGSKSLPRRSMSTLSKMGLSASPSRHPAI